MNYIHPVDFAAFDATSERVTQALLGPESGIQSCEVNCMKTPPGVGSPAGLHTHVVDQAFYILRGTMNLEVAGETFEAGPGTLVFFPAGVPHRNWNNGPEATIHLAINSPRPDPDRPFGHTVGEKSDSL